MPEVFADVDSSLWRSPTVAEPTRVSQNITNRWDFSSSLILSFKCQASNMLFLIFQLLSLVTLIISKLLHTCFLFAFSIQVLLHIAPLWARYQYPQPPLMWPLGLGAQKDVNRVLYFSIKINDHFRLNKNDMDWWYLCPCCPPFYFMHTFIIVLFVNVKTFRKLSKYLVCLGELLNRNCLSSNTQECLFTAKVKLKSLMSCTDILGHDT